MSCESGDAMLTGLNNAAALILELAAIAAFARWGWDLAEGPWLGGLLAILCAGLVVVLWGVFAAPLSPQRLAMPWLVLFKAGVFGAAVLTLAGSGRLPLAIALGLAAAAQLSLAVALGVP